MADAPDGRCPPDLLTAIRVVGLALDEALAGAGGHTVDRTQAVHPSLLPGDDGLWWPTDTASRRAFPDGLSYVEALGYTVAVAWTTEDAHREHRTVCLRVSGITSRPWSLRLPGAPSQRVGARDGLSVLRALQTIRRAAFPVVPWQRRDPAWENLEHHARAMEAMLRGPTPTTRIAPEVIASDLGRTW